MKSSALQWIRRKPTTPPSDDSDSTDPTSSPDDAKSGKKAQLVLDTFTLALDLAEQAVAIAEVAPFVAPAATLVRRIIGSYKELESANEERRVLAAYIADLTGDICATVLRMQETNHSDQIGRLEQDLEKYSALIKRAFGFVSTYDDRGKFGRFAGRKQLAEEMHEFTRELNSFGARFANKRLVDLYINQGANTQVLQEISETVTKEKPETWLGSPPDIKQMQHDTERLRTEGGLWFLQDKRFIEWENNAGMLWIEGPSGAGKSVLSSTVIQKLFADRSLFTDETKTPPAVAFFYFNFRDKHAQNVEIMLRRIVLQLSAASPHPYRILNDQYQVSNGQRLPSYQNLVEILKQLLQDLGRTYIVLDALDECDSTGFNQLVNLVATLRLWMETPLHVLLTSQTHSIFTTGFKGIPEIPLEFELQQADIRHFLASEFETNSDLAAWKSQQAKVMDGIVRKSNGMFRLASCLLHALASCLYGEPEELDETLKSLPNDLVTIYNRFMEAIPQKYLIYIEAALRWILFTSHQPLYLVQLADAISFDFMPEEYTYTPSRRAGNEGLILKWLGGLVVVRDIIDFMDRHLRVVTLAHASVQDYLFSHHFKNKFSSDLLEGISHVFLFKTCISYLLYFGHHPLPDDSEYEDTVKYPLLHYAATEWYHHLSYSHNREALLPMALQVLEAGSQPYCILLLSTADEWDLDPPPLHHCCRKGYIDCVRCLVGNGVNLNRAHINLVSGDYGTALAAASFWGEVEIVHLLLENGANVNLVCGRFGSALATASFMHNAEIARLLLEKGADVNLVGGQYGSALAMASHSREPKIVRLLLENGANVNLAGGEYGSALVTVCASPGYSNETPRPAIQIVRLLLENGADLKSQGTRALEEALKMWHEDIVALLHRQLDGVVSDTEDHMDEEETSSASDSE